MKSQILIDQKSPSKGLHITLWIAQVLLAGMFIMSGFMKVSQPIEQLSQMLPWASQVPQAINRAIKARIIFMLIAENSPLDT